MRGGGAKIPGVSPENNGDSPPFLSVAAPPASGGGGEGRSCAVFAEINLTCWGDVCERACVICTEEGAPLCLSLSRDLPSHTYPPPTQPPYPPRYPPYPQVRTLARLWQLQNKMEAVGEAALYGARCVVFYRLPHSPRAVLRRVFTFSLRGWHDFSSLSRSLFHACLCSLLTWRRKRALSFPPHTERTHAPYPSTHPGARLERVRAARAGIDSKLDARIELIDKYAKVRDDWVMIG